MDSLLARNIRRPTTVRTLAKDVKLTTGVSVLALLQALDAKARAQPNPRPFYLIAHRCNDVAKADAMMYAGANAIECDIRFRNNEVEFVVNHDNTWTYETDAIRPYLDGLAQLLKKHTHVALVIFDLKEDDANKAVRLREIIRKHLTDVVPIDIIISQADYSSREFFWKIRNDMRPREAYAIDQHDDPLEVSDYFVNAGIERHCYGDGVLAAGIDVNITAAVLRGVALKWSQRKIRWVYVWTIAAQTTMRNFIAMGVDGIMVNDVAALKAVMKEPAMSRRVRFATRADKPFVPPTLPGYVLRVRTGDVGWGGTDADVTFELRGSEGNLWTTIDVSPAGLFEAGGYNSVALIGADIGTLKEVVLSHDGSGDGPGWYVDSVEVQKSGANSVTRFKFGAWVEKGKPVSRGPG